MKTELNNLSGRRCRYETGSGDQYDSVFLFCDVDGSAEVWVYLCALEKGDTNLGWRPFSSIKIIKEGKKMEYNDMEEYERESIRRERDAMIEEARENEAQIRDVSPEDCPEALEARIKALEEKGMEVMNERDVRNGYTAEAIIKFLKGRLKFIKDNSPWAMKVREERAKHELAEAKLRASNARQKKDQ